MKRGLNFSLSIVALTTVCTTALSAESGETATIPPASEFGTIQSYSISYDDPRDLAEFYLGIYGFKASHASFEEVKHPSERSTRIVLVTVDGIADDALKGVQWRFKMRVSAGNWEAVEAGMRRKCHRGENAGKWTKALCP